MSKALKHRWLASYQEQTKQQDPAQKLQQQQTHQQQQTQQQQAQQQSQQQQQQANPEAAANGAQATLQVGRTKDCQPAAVLALWLGSAAVSSHAANVWYGAVITWLICYLHVS